MPRWIKPLTLCLLLAALAGCQLPRPALNNSARLMSRPDFPAARTAAPEWCRDALKTINQLEFEIENK